MGVTHCKDPEDIRKLSQWPKLSNKVWEHCTPSPNFTPAPRSSNNYPTCHQAADLPWAVFCTSFIDDSARTVLSCLDPNFFFFWTHSCGQLPCHELGLIISRDQDLGQPEGKWWCENEKPQHFCLLGTQSSLKSLYTTIPEFCSYTQLGWVHITLVLLSTRSEYFNIFLK